MELFQDSQDRVTLSEAVKHCHDDRLQEFIESSEKHIWRELEGGRRWGMVCDCAEHTRQRREEGVKHIACDRNSRRLRGAWEFVDKLAARLVTKAKHLTHADCGGNHEVYKYIHNMLLQAGGILRQRFGYLKCVPWACANADTIEGARGCGTGRITTSSGP